MRGEVSAFVLAVLLSVIVSYAVAQEMPTAPLVKPINPKLINITGTWKHVSMTPSVTGVCPAGGPASGSSTITKSGRGYTLAFVSGRVCKPASMCIFKGTLSGNELVLSNTAIVDNEGGAATNALRLTVYTNEHISGEGSSRYVHPEGFACHWRYGLTLTRKSGK